MHPARRPRNPLPPPRTLVGVTLFVSLLGMSACSPSWVSTRNQARLNFSRSHYCPLGRVAGASADTLAPPPSRAIADDPARLAMWRAAAIKRAGPRHLVAVSGCGERALYACWSFGGFEPSGRGTRYRTVGASCIEEDEP
jgi:hypothetical protein